MTLCWCFISLPLKLSLNHLSVRLVVPEIHLAHHCRTHCDSSTSTCPYVLLDDRCLPGLTFPLAFMPYLMPWTFVCHQLTSR
ncbi:hypothetical protein B0H11DRAFT_1331246 [Mycena galericulata]|nr:hypothetical protein B0H11DRAFT_1331246 [Mycena galericulata]